MRDVKRPHDLSRDSVINRDNNGERIVKLCRIARCLADQHAIERAVAFTIYFDDHYRLCISSGLHMNGHEFYTLNFDRGAAIEGKHDQGRQARRCHQRRNVRR